MISPEEVLGKTPEEIRELAKEKGLVPDQNKPDKWRDPQTGKERLLLHENGHTIDPQGNPVENERARAPHVHIFDRNGRGITDPTFPKPDRHFPLAP